MAAGGKEVEEIPEDEVQEEMEEAAKKAGQDQEIAQMVHLLTLSDELVPPAEKEEVRGKLMTCVEERSMAPFYESLCEKFGWDLDRTLLERLRSEVTSKVSSLDSEIADAKENFGDAEVLERTLDKMDFLSGSGDREAVAAVVAGLPEKLSTGQRVDIAMRRARLAFMLGDFGAARMAIVEAKEHNEKGGDWDRRNRLRIYEGAWMLTARDFAGACAHFLESVATFTCYEMFSFDDLVLYASLLALLQLDRPKLKARILDSPDVRAVLAKEEMADLKALLHGFYECRYADFFAALIRIAPAVTRDRYLSQHVPFLVRELRVRAYRQFLDSYRSVTLDGMAEQFGVTTDFVDKELSRFVAAKRVHAQIDLIRGIVETTRPEDKDKRFADVIRKGDAVLNRLQRLARTLHV